MASKIKPTTVRIPENLLSELKKVANNDGRSLNNFINKALKDAIKK